MKNYKTGIISFMAALFFLSACGKSDSEFGSQYKNRMGANPVDAAKAQEAGQQAARQGLEADVVDIQRHWTYGNEPGPRFVSATILINNQQTVVTATHVGTEISEGKIDVNGYQVAFHAMCGNNDCNPYYIAMEVYQNGNRIIQEGIRKYFEPTSADQSDIYQWFKPEEALQLMGSSISDVNGMVGYLNQGSTELLPDIL